MLNPDAIRVRHMLEAVVIAQDLAKGRARPDLNTDTMLTLAVVRCLEILGEAASKLTADLREQFPSIPCAQMVSMRNRLIHAYFDVDLDIVWTTLTDDLPRLQATLEEVLVHLKGTER